MAKVAGADGREYWMHIQAGWTTYVTEQGVYREAWLGLVERVRSLFGSLGLGLRPVELVQGRGPGELAGMRWTDRNFAKLVSGLETKTMVFVSAEWTVPGREPEPEPHPIVGQIPFPSGVSALVAFRNPAIEGPAYPAFGDPSRGSHVQVAVATWYLTLEEEDVVAEALSSWLVPVAEQTDAVWAFVTSDTDEDEYSTPYEEWHALGDEGARRAREHPRGYYWANLLNPGHLAKLGGLDQVAAQADRAGLDLEKIESGGKLRYALLTIPAGISTYTDDQLRAVRDILAPSLLGRRKRRKQREPRRRPLRVVED